MSSISFVSRQTVIPATWAQDVNDRVYGSVSIRDQAYLAPTNGTTDATTAINNASAAALAAGTPLIVPPGSYLYSGTVYTIESQSLVFNKGYGPTNEISQARQAVITINVASLATSPQASAATRYGMIINAETAAEQNVIGLRVNGQNESTGPGATTTCLYGHAVSISTANWSAAIHGETRHGGGASLALSSESASYTTAGTLYGLVVNNVTPTAGATHPLTGLAFVAHPSATGVLVQGSNNTDASGGWVYGIKLDTNSMRAGGIGVLFDCSAAVDAFIKTASTTAATVADIFLQGNSAYGIILNGTYTNGAIRVADDQYIALRTNAGIKMRYVVADSEFEILNSGSERFAVYLAANPYISLNDVQVVAERETGWSAMTGSANKATVYAVGTVTLAELAGRVKAIQDALTTHGLIGT